MEKDYTPTSLAIGIDPKDEWIPLDAPLLDGNERAYLNHCIDSNWISWQGEFCRRLEADLGKFCNCQHSFVVVNGTQALIMALEALSVGPGDEVIVPTLTMSATAFAVTKVGAMIVWADSSKGSLTVCSDDVARRITPRTKAVIAVHLYGRAVDMEALLKITGPRGIYVIEDVAEGIGAQTSGKRVGGLGTIACHSFHNKIISSGEGGAITLNDSLFAERVSELRTPPPNNKGSMIMALNNRMSNLACAVALAQLERLEQLIEKRRHVARFYDEQFFDTKGIRIFPERANEWCVYWRYQISLTEDYPFTREQLIEKLRKHNIEARPIFTLISEHPIYKDGVLARNDCNGYPNAEEVSAISIDIPSGPALTESNMRKVSDIIINPEKF